MRHSASDGYFCSHHSLSDEMRFRSDANRPCNRLGTVGFSATAGKNDSLRRDSRLYLPLRSLDAAHGARVNLVGLRAPARSTPALNSLA
jgi:hypothetical protein